MFKREFVILGVVSLTMGNSSLPLGNGLVADADALGELRLRQMLFFAQRAYRRAGYIIVHGVRSFLWIFLCFQHNRNAVGGQPPLRRVAVRAEDAPRRNMGVFRALHYESPVV